MPGVARKTANVVAAELGSAQGIVVDTHVRRLSQRLGLTRQEDPVKIERDLQRLVPREDWGRFPHLLIWHGRRVCDRADAALRELRAERPLPVEPCGVAAFGTRTRRERDEQAAVLVVARGRQSATTVLSMPGARARADERCLAAARRTPHSSAHACAPGSRASHSQPGAGRRPST